MGILPDPLNNHLLHGTGIDWHGHASAVAICMKDLLKKTASCLPQMATLVCEITLQYRFAEFAINEQTERQQFPEYRTKTFKLRNGTQYPS